MPRSVRRYWRQALLFCLLLCTLFVALSYLPAEERDNQAGFLPTWKLLSEKQKIDFMAGYLFGQRDAQQIIDIAIQYVRDNPTKAVESLERVKRLYDYEAVRPPLLAKEVDNFYSNPDNAQAPLSAAVSAGRARASS